MQHHTPRWLTATLLCAATLPGTARAQADDAPSADADTPAATEAETETDAAALGEEGETDIQIINGVPVNPELKAKLMESDKPLSVQEMMELSEKVLQDQQDQLEAQNRDDKSWMQGDPLGHLEGEMQSLVQDIDGSDTAEQTQARGEDVVRKMDTLIAMLEEASSAASAAAGGGQGSGQGQGQANGNNAAQDSDLAQGPGGSGDLDAAGEGNNRFEDLDPAQREAILRAQQEAQGVPAEFDALLSEYYQRLASEEALDTEADTEPAPDDTDAPGDE